MQKHVILGISGGIAAVKIPELIALLQKENLDISVIMTKGATAMLDPHVLEAEKNIKVYTDLFKNPISTEKILKERKVEHTNLAGSVDSIVIAPATANILAKLAHGMADDFLTTTVLAATCPIIICPSMNVHMWENPATQENIKILQSRGYNIIYPDSGLLACGYEGQGRLANVLTIAKEVVHQVNKSTVLQGKKIVITAGGTTQPIDDVRFIANKSSGKMGVALAESAYYMGADVLVLRFKTSVKPRFNIPEKIFETAEDLERLLQETLPTADICIHAAAVSDFAVKNPQKGKISSNKTITLELVPQKKILNAIKKINPKVQLIGFKAVYFQKGDSLQSKVSPLEQKKIKEMIKNSGAEFIVINDISRKDRGFEADTNEVWIVGKDRKEIHVPLASKTEVAREIINVIASEGTFIQTELTEAKLYHT